MNYIKGDIIKKDNIVFKDTNMIDFRMGGHPVVVLLDTAFTDEYMYFLTVSSKVHHMHSDPDRYHPLYPNKHNKLKRPSIVDLKCIYQHCNEVRISNSCISDIEYKIMANKLNNYQLNHIRDEVYDEVAASIDIDK